MPLRTSALRSLGAFANVFAIESFVDELAAERGEDPLAFRLRHLRDPRARAVIEAAAARAGWTRVAASATGVGHGIGLRALQEHAAPIAPWSPRSRATRRSACGGWSSRSTSAR